MTIDTPQAEPGAEEEAALSPIAFKDFLETTPPGLWRDVEDFTDDSRRGPGRVINDGDIFLHCSSDLCSGSRFFVSRFSDEPTRPGVEAKRNIAYLCRNCRTTEKVFSLWFARPEDGGATAQVCKIGEHPDFGPPLDNRLLKLLEEEKNALRKGYRSEKQGLGIGAFSYYRRVVENQKNKIIDEIIRVAALVNAGDAVINDLKTARNENQFKKAVESIKHGIPQALLVDGHNPLTLLHSALSDGLHARSDAECLGLATSIRVVLADLAERIAQALKDDRELKSSIGRLLTVKRPAATGS